LNLVQRIENRVVLPGDSETRSTQKVLAAALFLVAGMLTSLSAANHFANGLPLAGLSFLLFALLLFGAFIVELASSRYHEPLVYVVFTAALLSNLSAHLFTGGTTSGGVFLGWAVLTPLLAVLLLDQRALRWALPLFLLVVLLAVLLEPWARSRFMVDKPRFMLANFAFSLVSLGLMIALTSYYLVGRIEFYRQRSERLLLNILPDSIAVQLKESPATIADGHREVTVLFADIVDFTDMTADADPVDVVNLLNDIFSEFDQLAEKYGLEKIKTIGDAYMVAAGLPEPRPDHAEATVAFALEMLAVVKRFEGFEGEPIRLRVGINTGPVVAGVIGRNKFIYDLWGDAVNVASRMESNGLANEIQVTAAVKEKLQGRYQFEARGPVYVKGKGEMTTYLLTTNDDSGLENSGR
jgi:adenylate cyclase